MATMRDIVNGAATRLRKTRAGRALPPTDFADILEALNDMMGSWEGKGININWSGALTENDTFPLDLKHEAGVKAMLAVRVSEDFGKAVGAVLARDAQDGWNAIMADYDLPDQIRVDEALSNMPSQRRII